MFHKLHNKAGSELEDWYAMGGLLANFTQIGVGFFLLLWIPVCAIIWLITWPAVKLKTSILETFLLYLLVSLLITNQYLTWKQLYGN